MSWDRRRLLHLAERLSEQCNLHKEFSDDLTVVLMKHYAGISCLTSLERQLIDDQLERDRDRKSHPLAQNVANAGPSGFQMPPFAQSQYLKLTKADDESPPSDLLSSLPWAIMLHDITRFSFSLSSPSCSGWASDPKTSMKDKFYCNLIR